MSAGATPYPAADATRIGFRLHLRGDFSAADAAFRAAVTEGASESDLAVLHAAAASTSWALGDVDTCRARSALAHELAERSGDDRALGWAWVSRALHATLDGDAFAEGHAFLQAARHAARAGDTLTQTRIFANLGHRLTTKGHHQEALKQLDRAFNLLLGATDAEEASLIEAQLRENYGRALRGLGRCREALAEFESARRLWLEAGAPQVRRALLALADTNLVLGSASRAASAYREVIQLSEGANALQSLAPALAGLARATVVDDPEECDRALQRVLDMPSGVAPVVVHLAAGWVALARGMRQVAIGHGREAEREAGRQEDETGLGEALELISLAMSPDRNDGRVAEARMIWIENEDALRIVTSEVILARRSGDLVAERDARARLRSLGVRGDTDRIAGPLMALGREPSAAVEIHTLGAFGMTRNGARVGPAAWPNQDSFTLLKILLSCLGRGISRAEVVRRLWPDGALPVDGLTRAVEDLRTVLDPHGHRARDEWVRVDADVVTLDPLEVVIDAVAFERAARFSLSAFEQKLPRTAEHLEVAAALYTGAFLEGEDARWVIATREGLAALHRRVRQALVEQRGTDPEQVVPWLIGLVQEDPYDGDTHLELVRALTAADRPSEASRSYAAYTMRMAEVGRAAEPMPQA